MLYDFRKSKNKYPGPSDEKTKQGIKKNDGIPLGALSKKQRFSSRVPDP